MKVIRKINTRGISLKYKQSIVHVVINFKLLKEFCSISYSNSRLENIKTEIREISVEVQIICLARYSNKKKRISNEFLCLCKHYHDSGTLDEMNSAW